MTTLQKASLTNAYPLSTCAIIIAVKNGLCMAGAAAIVATLLLLSQIGHAANTSTNTRGTPSASYQSDRTDLNLPDIGDSSEQVFSYREQRSVGIGIIKQLFDAGLLLEDPLANDYIQTLGEQVAAGIPRDFESARPPVEFYIIDDNRINAFALPGGFVVVNRGLMLQAKNESELAGVLAHELAHVEQLHIARSLEQSQKLDVFLAGAVLAALVFGGGDPTALQAALSIGLAGSAQGRINFTRAHEYEADRVGIGYLHNAGFDPQGMVDFFARLQEKDRYFDNDVPEILRTHPLSSQRILEARQRAERMTPGSRGSGSERFYIARERLRVLSSASPSDTLKLYDNTAALPELTPNALRYGKALSQLQLSQHQAAIDNFEILENSLSPTVEYTVAHALALHNNRQSQLAINVLERAKKQYIDHPAIASTHAEILLDLSQYSAAKTRILDSLSAQKQPQSWRMLADAASRLGNNGEAHLYMSEYYLLHREVGLALKQLELGAARQDNSAYNQQRLNARLDEIRDAVGSSHQSRHWKSNPSQ